jgi:hypothetical protein
VAIARDHELHGRRLGRNVGVAACLAVFIGIVFALSVVKITTGEPTERFDHVARPQLAIEAERLDPPAPLPEDG